MGKRIIFCADGTWDSPKDNTNVYKLFTSIPITANQIAFYDQGVGVDGGPLEKLLGGAFGHGLFEKVKSGYTKIAHVYEPGDEIFIFGFSRGAYVARSLAGMIAACGLPGGNFDETVVETAFKAYREKDNRSALLATLADKNMAVAPIKMVGVWDTVGALGVPAIFGGVDPAVYGFLDTSLHPNVKNAYQALAIDEERREFPPTLWKEPQTPVPGQTIEQVWFTGAHSDVGGGYPDDECGLSDITLGWMMKKAEKLGLVIDSAISAKYAAIDAKYSLSKEHHSWSLLWGFPKDRDVPKDATLSNSVVIRTQFDKSYRPDNLKFSKKGALSPSYKVSTVVPPVPPANTGDKPAPAAGKDGKPPLKKAFPKKRAP
jgi:uncharacterized protein (DUF2235 family)